VGICNTSSLKMAEVWMLFSLFLPFLEVGGWEYEGPPASSGRV
jgi:hypothetical protein